MSQLLQPPADQALWTLPTVNWPDDCHARRRRKPQSMPELVGRAAELRLVLRYPTDEADVHFAELHNQMKARK